MNIKVIKTDAELDAAMDRLEALAMANPEPTGDIAEKMELLSLVIADYENKNYPIEAPTPIEAIQFVMEQRQLKVKDIAPCFGSTARTYAVLSGSRNLSLNMIRRLHETLNIPADCLISRTIQSS
ncbi:MAG: transcriptional regulator [Lentisphaeria bacterium]